MTGVLPDPRMRPWLTVAELAELTGEGEKAIRAAITAGHIPHLQVGRYVRIPTASFAALCGIPIPEDTEAGPRKEPAAALTSSSEEPRNDSAAERRPPSNLRASILRGL